MDIDRDRDPELGELLDRLPRLDQGELLAIAAEFHPSDPAHERAWAAARLAAAAAGLEDQLDLVRDRIAAWAAHGAVVTGQHLGAGPADELTGDARLVAAGAVVDAAAALLLGGRLDPADRDVLLGPWRGAIEE